MIPPVSPDLDLRDFQYMPLDVIRLVDSDLTAIASGDEFKAAVILWCKAWHQVPASSLPDDDRMLAHLSGFGRDVKGWQKVRDVALRGFKKHSDGRLYHPVIAEKAREAGDAKQRQRARTQAATAARRQRHDKGDDERDEQLNGQRHDKRDGGRDDARNGNRNVHQGIGIGNIGEVVARARDPDTELEHRLREAAGWQSDPSPNLAIIGPIQALIDNGAHLELDILPTIKAIAPQAQGRSWNYFVKAIARARDRRVEAATIVSPSTIPSRSSHAARPRKPSRAETFAAIDRRIEEIRQAELREAAGGTENTLDLDEGPT